MRCFWLGILVGTMMLAACGDNDSDFATRPTRDSLSSSSVTLSEVEGSSVTSVPSSSSAKSSLSSATSSNNVKSSSSSKDVFLSGDSREKSSESKSSSSETKSSSSSVTSQSSSSSASASNSSSLAGRILCDVNTDKNCFKDERDGQNYKTVKIGTQIWMAENLNFETLYSYCYNDFAEYCTKYGRLYTWAAAMDSAGVYSVNSKGCGYGGHCSVKPPARGICPEGWHVPTWAEWDSLYSAIGSSPYAMQAKGFDNWPNATDAYGFSALPAGNCYHGICYGVGLIASFWSASEGSSEGAYEWVLGADGADFSIGHGSEKICSFSVRCVKD